MTTEEYQNCPVGISNKKEIELTGEKLTMAIERIEEKLCDLKEDVSEGFSNVNNRLDKFDDRFKNLESGLPEMIDERIRQNTTSKVMNVLKWVFFTLCGSVTITVVTKLIIQALKLN